jgi:hypothetical protein
MNYRIETQLIAEPKQVLLNEKCNGIVFVNRGTNPAIINGEILNTDESLSNNGLEGEFDRTKYEVKFDTTGAGTSILYVRQKVYE